MSETPAERPGKAEIPASTPVSGPSGPTDPPVGPQNGTGALVRDVDGQIEIVWPAGRGPYLVEPEFVEGWARYVNALRDEVRHLTIASACEIELDLGRPLHEQIDRQWSRRYREDHAAWHRERDRLRALLGEALNGWEAAERRQQHGFHVVPCYSVGECAGRIAEIRREAAPE